MSKHKRSHHDAPVTRRQMVRALDRLKQDIVSAIIHASEPLPLGRTIRMPVNDMATVVEVRPYDTSIPLSTVVDWMHEGLEDNSA